MSKTKKGSTSPKSVKRRPTTLGDTQAPFNALPEVASGVGSHASRRSSSISHVMVTLSSNIGEGDVELDLPAF